jgi:PRTRC genetic system protein F
MNAMLQPVSLLPAAPLALPRLSSDVPHTVAPSALSAANARVARFLIDAHVFGEADIPNVWEDALTACERALTTRIRCEIGPLYCLKPGFVMRVLDAQGFTVGSHDMRGSADNRPTYQEVEICWGETSEQEWPVGQKLQALETALPGLGRTVLQVLRERCALVYPLFTPDIACDLARMIYWNGEDDEEAALDMYCDGDEQEREAMRSEMLTRAMLDQAYPKWAQEWMGQTRDRKRPRRCSLRRAAKVVTDPRLRQIVADVQALSRLQCNSRFLPECDGDYIGFGAALSWQAGDVTTRIYDDLIQMAYQSEFCDRMGEVRIGLDDPAALAAWWRAMRPHFKTIRLIDRLIYELSI